MVVCSHRGVHSPWQSPIGSPLYPPLPGSPLVQAMQWHSKRLGIQCFDLDVSVTLDGKMLVGHPYESKRVLRLPDVPGNLTEAAVRRIDERGALAGLADVLAQAQQSRVRTLTLEPKHKLSEDFALLRQFAAATAAAVTPTLRIYLIFFGDAADTVRRLRSEFPGLRFALGMRDTPAGALLRACDGEAGAGEALAPYDMIMPSVAAWARCKAHLHKEIRRKRILVHTWTIDTAEAVVGALGSDAVVTNKPAQLAHHCAERPRTE
eukprot:TRINITY_DN23067_c0_g1_i2.p1 TRINITY_DN23067_c0_g1~~TRINITY_DN23067_c0_g1_i2.p1  ORF type:complete len:264 (+),score=70.91 TRINITY_DN23067_c0_g1_i2:265-1056(+)